MMDCTALLAALPAGPQFNGMQPYQKKEVAENFILSIIEAIAAEHREPDAWEAHDIAAAIGYIASHWHNAALAAGDRALTPPEQRAPNQPNLAAPSPTLADLRGALNYVSLMPARVY